MEFQVADTGPCRKTITIHIPADKVRAHLEHVMSDASRQVRMKGFRPGKVPKKVLEAKFGAALQAEAKESLVNESFQEAMRGTEVALVGNPRVEGLDNKPLDPAVPLEFKVHLDIRPQVELGETKGLAVTQQPTDATDEDVDSALQQIAGQKRKLQPVAEPAQEGDFIQADATYRCDAEVVHSQQGMRLNTGIPIAGTDPEAFSQQLTGCSKGDSRKLEITFPTNFAVEAVRGKTGEVELQIQDVMRVQPPPIDDEFAKGYDFDSLDALKADLRTKITGEKERLEKIRQEDQCIEALMKAHDFPLPEGLVEDETQAQLRNFAERMKQSKVSEEEIEQRVGEAKDEARQEAEKRVRIFFLLEAIARQQKIFVTESDVEEAIRTLAAQHNATPEAVKKHYEEHNLLGDLRLGILERRVRDFLRENARITDS
ncbi:MAG: trigger factor [Planctomycetota bacterium]